MGESAIVLCGGRSARMGRDKAALPFGNETLLARVVRLVSEVADDVVLVAREGQALPERVGQAERDGQASASFVVRDPAEGLGPLAGIAAGLGAIRGPRALVVACDMPLLRPALARRLLELAREADALVPVVDGFPVPTCAVYSRTVAGRARQLVAARELRPRAFLESVKTRFVAAEELRAVDPALESFRDCDTEEDYRAALRAAGLAAFVP
jgi:molybdopterin-guanine dinucleotide biosynthesis protein A